MSDTQSTVEYRDIPGHPGYRVGNDGSFWSNWKGSWSRRKLSIYDGALVTTLRGKSVKCGRTILNVFVGPQPTMQCGYKDGNRMNIALSNLLWKYQGVGDKVGKGGGRQRARKMYRLGPCIRCKKPATDRHHKDDNTANNHPSNIEILCRRCHMAVDGRAKRLAVWARTLHQPQPPKPCVKCGRPYKPLRRGLCSRCNDSLRRSKRNGADI